MKRKLIGFSEDWRAKGEGTRAFYLFWIKVWSTEFCHSTTFLDE